MFFIFSASQKMSWVTVKFQASVALSFSASCQTGGFGSIQQFVDHLLSLIRRDGTTKSLPLIF